MSNINVYIQQARQSGMTDEQIKKELIASGWSEKDIIKMLSGSVFGRSRYFLIGGFHGVMLLIAPLFVIFSSHSPNVVWLHLLNNVSQIILTPFGILGLIQYNFLAIIIDLFVAFIAGALILGFIYKSLSSRGLFSFKVQLWITVIIFFMIIMAFISTSVFARSLAINEIQKELDEFINLQVSDEDLPNVRDNYAPGMISPIEYSRLATKRILEPGVVEKLGNKADMVVSEMVYRIRSVDRDDEIFKNVVTSVKELARQDPAKKDQYYHNISRYGVDAGCGPGWYDMDILNYTKTCHLENNNIHVAYRYLGLYGEDVDNVLLEGAVGNIKQGLEEKKIWEEFKRTSEKSLEQDQQVYGENGEIIPETCVDSEGNQINCDDIPLTCLDIEGNQQNCDEVKLRDDELNRSSELAAQEGMDCMSFNCEYWAHELWAKYGNKITIEQLQKDRLIVYLDGYVPPTLKWILGLGEKPDWVSGRYEF